MKYRFCDRPEMFNDEEVVKELGSNNFLDCSRAISETVKRRIINNDSIKILFGLKDDNRVFWNDISVGTLATAALHLLGISNYNGDDSYVIALIDGNMGI